MKLGIDLDYAVGLGQARVTRNWFKLIMESAVVVTREREERKGRAATDD